MSSATSSVSSAQRVNTAPSVRPVTAARASIEPTRSLRLGTEEAAVLKLDLSDIPLPKVGELSVDGFKPSFFQRLFGKR